MIGAVREWLISVVAVSLLLSAMEMLVPEGSIRKILSFAGGLVLLITLVQPLLDIRPEHMEVDWRTYQQTVARRQEELTADSGKELQRLIESRSGAYISDKADSLGISVSVRVTAEQNENGVPVPREAELTGTYSAELAAWLERELDIPAERQVWNEVEN